MLASDRLRPPGSDDCFTAAVAMALLPQICFIGHTGSIVEFYFITGGHGHQIKGVRGIIKAIFINSIDISVPISRALRAYLPHRLAEAHRMRQSFCLSAGNRSLQLQRLLAKPLKVWSLQWCNRTQHIYIKRSPGYKISKPFIKYVYARGIAGTAASAGLHC